MSEGGRKGGSEGVREGGRGEREGKERGRERREGGREERGGRDGWKKTRFQTMMTVKTSSWNGV